jgi:hypothetical protein
MMTSGLYDGAGEFAYRVGLPAKSGIGGGILAIAPNTASIAVWSPGLDESGNSKLGTLALEMLTDRLDWSSFGKIKTLQGLIPARWAAKSANLPRKAREIAPQGLGARRQLEAREVEVERPVDFDLKAVPAFFGPSVASE